MTKLVDRHQGRTERGGEGTRRRPVVLGTLSVRVDPSAERMAIDSAIEAGVPLVIANILRLRPMPTTLALVGPEGLNLPHEEDLDAVRATAARAAALGVETELLRVTTRHPINALLEIVRERNAGPARVRSRHPAHRAPPLPPRRPPAPARGRLPDLGRSGRVAIGACRAGASGRAAREVRRNAAWLVAPDGGDARLEADREGKRQRRSLAARPSPPCGVAL